LFRKDNRLRMKAATSRQSAIVPVSPDLPAHDEDDDDRPTLRFRAIFISDVHLGTPGCQAVPLLDFLRHTESRDLYLVGDIIDGWQLKRRWYWHQTHNDVVQKVLRKARKGTHVTYIAGNHDEAMRHFLGLAFGGIDIRDEAEHVTADGKRMLITHGDLFDAVVQGAKWLAHVGDALYLFSLRLNRWFNHVRAKLGLPYWSLAQFLKHRVKNAVGYITQFEDALAHEARRRGFDGVICGHIHKAEIRDIGGIRYCNDGDWVESLTALVELENGELRIIDWKAIDALQRGALNTEARGLAYSPGD
jgi:UDP-2,3-diacylglucosamine pyrophosphatase LpxH